MNDGQVHISEADLARLLPTCQRCRRLRRKCDTELPACRLCQKGKAECTFFDHALQQTLPRSYVHSLITRLSRLRSVQATADGTQDPYQPYQSAPSHPPEASRSTGYAGAQHHEWGTYTSDLSFDKHFVVSHANPTCWQFFGSSSAYALAVEVLVHASAKFGSVTSPEHYAGSEFWLNAQAPEELGKTGFKPTPSRDEVTALVQLYMKTTNVLIPCIVEHSLVQDIEAYLRIHGPHARYMTGSDAHKFFRVSMVCAVAAANKSRHHPEYSEISMAYYAEGLQCVEEVTSDVSVEALQALMLLILFTLFYPRKGDIWKLLDYACRLSVELNYHTEPNDDYETEDSRLHRRLLFWGIYTIERTIGQHLGRPSDLPEDIITAEYPATIKSISVQDPEDFQAILTSHYYRLTYMRSEIFRELYMPATAPDLPHSWYQERLEQIISWRKEYRYLENHLGMGSMTCEMGFDSSICFLFQPLLLRALATTKVESVSPATVDIIPRESYKSACGVIDFYSRLLGGSEESPYGTYPMTLISAHYIYSATLIVLAHWLLALDNRLAVVTFSGELSRDLGGSAVDLSSINIVNEQCLTLLTWVSRRWAGMLGMYDIYNNLQERILPLMGQNSGVS